MEQDRSRSSEIKSIDNIISTMRTAANDTISRLECNYPMNPSAQLLLAMSNMGFSFPAIGKLDP